MTHPEPETIQDVQRALASESGRGRWKRLEDFARSDALLALLRRDYPAVADLFADPVGRRDFLRLMGASLALSGLGACTRQPEELIFPYGSHPEPHLPGKPLFFATAMQRGGGALGLLAESHEGRPTKIEGNPDHPASLGATDAIAQASVLQLYDPERSRSTLRGGRISTWGAFQDELAQRLRALPRDGEGLRLLTRTVVSPTVGRTIDELRERMPAMRWHQWDPVHRDHARRGAMLAFGRDVSTRYRFDRARVVLSIDGDVLGTEPGHVRYARDFVDRRRAVGEPRSTNRLYVAESTSTITGAFADHLLPLKPARLELFARLVARELGIQVETGEGLGERARRFARAAAADLRASGSEAVVAGGAALPPHVHALVHAMNERLGATGTTVVHAEPVEHEPVDQTESLRELVTDMLAGRVRVLVVLGGNPAYDSPADVPFSGALEDVRWSCHLSMYADETSRRCHWHLPMSHFLESWGDARAFDGTTSIVQPLIAPLYRTRTELGLLSALAGRAGASDHEAVRDTWREMLGGDGKGFEEAWQIALHDGVVAESELTPVEARLGALEMPPPPGDASALELVVRPDANVWDGSFANNGWLQELPRPLTRISWDNAALLGGATAGRLGVKQDDVVRLSVGGREVEAPAWIHPDHPEDCVTVHLGYGRRAGGGIARGVGFDAYRLRAAGHPWSRSGLAVERTRRRHALVSVQMHRRMEGRDLVRVATFEEFDADPHVFEHRHPHHEQHSLYPEFEYLGSKWGMLIDLNACIGCNACMVACQAENNVPIVGREQVEIGREMHWLRIDTYFPEEHERASGLHHQPVPCMHCEKAPCELVCPVNATVHDAEGLNAMIYNRCVGTRYCSNNCPYKVRRFNFYQYTDWETESLKLGRNPEVTPRSRGVMEKCTYCVQRISRARIEAKLEDRGIRDGDVVTACAQACPTQAISFGDLNDEEATVTRWDRQPQKYALLAELGTQPRTRYLAKLRNPNPELEEG